MNWRKYIIIALDVVIGVYLVIAMMAFDKPKEKSDICQDVHITIEQETLQGFLSEKDIQQMLNESKLRLIQQPMDQINTRQVEELLESHDLIENAECYKAIQGSVCINIKQRIPIIRIMADNGEDYYVDNHGKVIQHNNYTCNLLVATGHITKQYASKVLAPLAITIMEDDFWRNQVVQLNILDDESVEVIPRVGEHIAYIGQPTKVSSKLERLRKFYRYGLNKTGWNLYSRISVEFDNQIICKKKKIKKA
jgi:cell division protein FtsQ